MTAPQALPTLLMASSPAPPTAPLAQSVLLPVQLASLAHLRQHVVPAASGALWRVPASKLVGFNRLDAVPSCQLDRSALIHSGLTHAGSTMPDS